MNSNTPMILAPAGNTTSFLAAIAAGADAIYCGLKIFSARMEADNFSIEELSRLQPLQNPGRSRFILPSTPSSKSLSRIKYLRY